MLADIRGLSWIEIVPVDALAELVAFSDFVRILGSRGRDIGEASILAWALISGGVAIVDDQAAVNAARANNVTVRRSLALIGDGVHKRVITLAEARSLVDDLASAGGARLPCDGAGFEVWAEANGFGLRDT